MVNNKLKVLEKLMIINWSAKYDRHTTNQGRNIFRRQTSNQGDEIQRTCNS
jgi:hypothetical protein